MSDAQAERGRGHGALMDGVYRRQRHIYDATRKYFLLGRDRVIEELRPGSGQSVVEVGCGTGRNLIVAARRYPSARFFGFDISEMMLETARAKVASAGLSDRITLAQGDAASWSPAGLFGPALENGFDRVLMSYTLSMIPPWREALAEGVAALAPGGALHVVDFGPHRKLHPVFAKPLGAWLAKFHVSPRVELEKALRTAAAAEGRASDWTPLYRDYAVLGKIE